MALIRVLSRVAFLTIATVLVCFVVVNHESFGVELPRLEFRYWAGAGDVVLAPAIPLFVFCAGFFVLGVVLMGLASMQVYVEVVGSWRRLRTERRRHEPERREVERARAALAREREEHEPKRRELEFRAQELDHRAEEQRRDRESLAEARSHLAAERAELAKSRAELGSERNDVERARLDVETARAVLERDRARAARDARAFGQAQERLASDVEAAGRASTVPAGPDGTLEQAFADVPISPAWNLAERLDDDVAAVARLSETGDSPESDASATEPEGSPDGDPRTAR